MTSKIVDVATSRARQPNKFFLFFLFFFLLLFLSPAFSAQAVAAPKSPIVYAVWYNVPPNSLARRRAGKNEFTAAHNSLPIGTLVRVTRISNGRSVVVRITDRGITVGRAKIDLCREAAEKLGMLSDGIARVRLEVLEKIPVAGSSARIGVTTSTP